MNVVQIAIVSIGQWRRGGGGGGGGAAERRRTRLELTENQSQRGNSKFFPSDNRHFIVDVFMKTEYKSP